MLVRYSLAIVTGCLAAITIAISLLYIVPVSGADALLVSALSLVVVWVPMSLYFSTLTIKLNVWMFLLLSIFVLLNFYAV